MMEKVDQGGWPTRIKKMREKLKRLWRSIDQASFKKLLGHYPAMLKAVLAAKGDRGIYIRVYMYTYTCTCMYVCMY